ncbi:hypothetical protein QVD17_19654 [Tagetes erecta]|uniref:Transposase-associated domain-containing protein n=1 Tax=Tagetes erecta TaxID=13708 RepID=A0AAD8KJZ7_TARER|nr:hypothetical protein QVD17_19654 [Tagetes erecta]
MDRSNWMYNTRRTDSICIIGVQDFLKAAEAHRVNEGAQLIFCPCASCKNFQKHYIEYVQLHLLRHGFYPGYTCWSMHRESFANCSTSSINLDDDNINSQYTDNENDALNDNNDNFDDMKVRKHFDAYSRVKDLIVVFGKKTYAKKGTRVEKGTQVTEFCTGYLDGVKSIGVPESRHSGRLEGVGGVGMKTKPPDYDLLQAAHFVVLKHMTCIAPYVNKHKFHNPRLQNFDKDWPHLMKKRPHLTTVDYKRVQLWIAARATKDLQTGNRDTIDYDATIEKLVDANKKRKCAGAFGDERYDALTQVKQKFKGLYKRGTGRMDTGPSGNVSRENQSVEASPGFRGSRYPTGESHIIYPDMENVCECELLWPFGSRNCDTIANGQAYPTSERYLDDITMHEHCVKILNASTQSASRSPSQTRTCDAGPSVEGYIPQMELSSNDSETQNDFIIDPAFIQDMVDDGLFNTELNVFEEFQTQHVQQQMVTTGMFPAEITNFFEPEALLQLFIDEWIDITIVFWFTWSQSIGYKLPLPNLAIDAFASVFK